MMNDILVAVAGLLTVFTGIGAGIVLERARWRRHAGSARFVTADNSAYSVYEVNLDGTIEKNVSVAKEWVHQPGNIAMPIQFFAHVKGDLSRLVVKYDMTQFRRFMVYCVINRKSPPEAYAAAIEGLAAQMREQIRIHDASGGKKAEG